MCPAVRKNVNFLHAFFWLTNFKSNDFTTLLYMVYSMRTLFSFSSTYSKIPCHVHFSDVIFRRVSSSSTWYPGISAYLKRKIHSKVVPLLACRVNMTTAYLLLQSLGPLLLLCWSGVPDPDGGLPWTWILPPLQPVIRIQKSKMSLESSSSPGYVDSARNNEYQLVKHI